MPTASQSAPFLRSIEWNMLDKRKFLPLSMLSSFSSRCCFYPLILIKTKIQMQHKNDIYSGMFDAAFKIYNSEGARGLYKGFWISSTHILTGVIYITAYEGVRHLLSHYELSSQQRALLAGGFASFMGQNLVVPIDVISQHAMVLGMRSPINKMHVNGSSSDVFELNPLGIDKNRSRMKISMDIIKAIYRKDGFFGYYRGYWASLVSCIPSSAFWWTFYHFYQENLLKVLPENSSHLLIQCTSGILSGCTTTTLTNPLDTVRARLQVNRMASIALAFRHLWREEGLAIFVKGLSVRLTQSAVFSFSMVLGYETIKRMAIDDKYQHMVRW